MDDDMDFDEAMLMEAASQVDRHIEATKPRPEHLQCLKTHFGHSEFRPKQWDIIRSIIEDKRDNCVIMPTGYGKSLCFQFPAVYSHGITLVVSPLISLMQDQVNALSVANIPACYLGSAQSDRNIESQVIAGDFRMVYASPEYLNGDRGQNLLRKLELKLTLVAIDESHCISAYGHAFRPEYRKLGSIRNKIPSVPILAVTATATEHVRDDIIHSLRLKNPHIVSMGFDRPNIHFSFQARDKKAWDDLKPFVTNVRGSVIIYVLTKAISEDVARFLRDNGVNCEIYHAGLSLTKRRNVLDDFIKDRLKIIVATVAFGMGIDKPDVRCVIHYGASKNIESYYQEVGRAGRDGQPSKAITFFDKSDFGLHDWFLNENHEHQSERVIQHLREIGQKMRDFCHTSMCRRKYLLEYFGSEASHISRANSKCCDNCDSGSSRITLSDKYEGIDDDGNYDFTENAYLLLKAMEITSKAAVAISVLRGSSEKKALDFKNYKEIYGAGKIWPKEYWGHLVEQLKDNDYITIKKLPLPYRPIKVVSPKGSSWLKRAPSDRLILKAKPEMYQYLRKKKKKVMLKIPAGPSTSTNLPTTHESKNKTDVEDDDRYQNELELSDKHLEEILLGIRAVLAENSDCMPYLVASNLAVQQMVQKKPVSVKEFKSYIIDGFSVAKIDKFASVFIDGIIKFMDNDFCLSKLLQTYPLKTGSSQLSVQEIRQLQRKINENKSLSSISKEINRTEAEVVAEIIILIRSGYPITKDHLEHLVGATNEIITHIKAKVTNEDFSNMGDIAEIQAKFAGNSHITKHILVLVMNYLKVRRFLDSIQVPYFDTDKNQLMNGTALLGSKAIEKIKSAEGTNDLSDQSIDESQCNQPNDIKGTKTNGSSQNGESTNFADVSDEDEMLAAAIADEFDNQIELSKPLKTSQKPNLSTEIKKFEAKPPVKMPVPQNKPVTSTKNVKKRTATLSKYKVEYYSDSDDEDDDDAEPQSKRKLPQWLTTKKANPTNTAAVQSVPVRKKAF